MRYDRLAHRDWRNLNTSLMRIEYYNGRGYENRDRRSPYLWGGSQFFDKGKYISDGKYDPSAETRQIGIALLLKALDSNFWTS